MRQLPNSLLNFTLDLYSNNLGENVDEMKWLGEGIKQLPNSLLNLGLNLESNNLGKNVDNLVWLG